MMVQPQVASKWWCIGLRMASVCQWRVKVEMTKLACIARVRVRNSETSRMNEKHMEMCLFSLSSKSIYSFSWMSQMLRIWLYWPFCFLKHEKAPTKCIKNWIEIFGYSQKKPLTLQNQVSVSELISRDLNRSLVNWQVTSHQSVLKFRI